MYTMSLYESGESTGDVSLRSLFQNQFTDGIENELTVENLGAAICRGGWPSSVGKTQKSALLIGRSYVDAICESDASQADGISKDPNRVRALLRSYRRNISTLASTKPSLKILRTMI